VFGTIESVKAVSELFAPISGEVIAINTDLGVHPELINAHPHETWMIRLKPGADSGANALLDASAYADLVK
jgi:glycine cleavage system H protein